MSLLKNWKAQRQERIAAAETRKKNGGVLPLPGKVVMDTSKVDPRAKEFLEYVTSVLEDEGVSSKELRDTCCYELFETMTRSFNVKALDRGPAQDKFLMQMAGAISRAGISSEDTQEKIIILFLARFKRIGGY